MEMVTAMVRERAGAYSAVMVEQLGSAPPMPRPATKRRMMMLCTSGAKPMATVAAPNSSTLKASTRRRPIRSAMLPAMAMPTAMPIRPEATAGAKAARVMPHSLMIIGMAKPIS